MKRFYTLLIVVFSCQLVSGQVYFPLVDTGKTWSTYHDYCKSKWYPFSEYSKFSGDTMIAGVTYKKVWNSQDSLGTSWTLNSFIREDIQKRVFFIPIYSSQERLLYNFSSQVGDILDLQSTNSTAYRVDSIFMTTLLDGEQRREFFLHDTTYLCTDTWIEGIGSLSGVLCSGTCGMVGDSPNLMCFTEHDTVKYHNPMFEQCYLVTGIVNNSGTNLFKIFPNPARESLTIESELRHDHNLSFEVYDLLGNVLLNLSLCDRKTIIFLKNTLLHPGIFIYHVMDGLYPVASGKLTII